MCFVYYISIQAFYRPFGREFWLNKKCPSDVTSSNGLGGTMGVIVYHDFLSTPMLLNSSELMFETSRSALARARKRSKQIITARTNIGCLLSLIKYNDSGTKKLHPLSVL